MADSSRSAAARYRAALAALRDKPADLSNIDLDTGHAAAHGEYALADDTYAQLLDRLAKRDFRDVPRPLAASILRYYDAKPTAASQGKEERKHRERVRQQLENLRSSTAVK